MYAQDATNLEQTMPWPGFGYGGIGAGNASFPAWFNKTADNSTTPLNVAAAWKLQADLVLNTPNRLQLQGDSPNGFAALAGRSGGDEEYGEVQVLLNNYQLDYDIPREIANGTVCEIVVWNVRGADRFTASHYQCIDGCVSAFAAEWAYVQRPVIRWKPTH